jgi:Uma2 family endonuclease
VLSDLHPQPGVRWMAQRRVTCWERAGVPTGSGGRKRLRDLRADYEEIGVPEVWLVRAADRSVEVRVLETGGYRSDGIYRDDEPIRSRELPDLRLAAARCFD